MAESPTQSRYTKVAIALHWLIAISILLMIPMGIWMHRAINDPAMRETAYGAYQFHKSLGLTILALSLARLAWRLTHTPPPMPEHMPAWEKFAAKATHWAFYFLMIALPLSGWVYVSTGWSLAYDRALPVPTVWFGLFTVPHLPGFAEGTNEARAATAGSSLNVHFTLALGALALIALHIGAALKHNFVDKDETLEHMIPGARRNYILPGIVTVFAAFTFLQAFNSFNLKVPPATAQQAAAPIETPAEAPALSSEAAQVAEATPAPSVVAAPATNEAPAVWKVDKAASKIEFTGEALSGPFNGSFGLWTADIKFSPNNLPASKAVVTIQTTSAVIPDPTGTAMLKENDWFAVEKFATATYTTTGFRKLAGDRYEADGVLKIRDKSAPLKLPFTLTIANGVATMKGTTRITRLTWDVGKGTATEAAGEDAWASGVINVTVTVRATQ